MKLHNWQFNSQFCPPLDIYERKRESNNVHAKFCANLAHAFWWLKFAVMNIALSDISNKLPKWFIYDFSKESGSIWIFLFFFVVLISFLPTLILRYRLFWNIRHSILRTLHIAQWKFKNDHASELLSLGSLFFCYYCNSRFYLFPLCR